MRLLFAADLAYPDHAGGSHRFVYEVARRLAQRGHDVHLICGKVAPDALTEEQIDGIRYHRLDRNRRNFLTHALSYLLGARRTYQSLSHEAPFDIVSAHYILPALGILAAQGRRKVPIIYTFHGPWAAEFAVELEWSHGRCSNWGRFFRAAWTALMVNSARLLEWAVLNGSTRVHTLSRYMAEVAAQQYRVPLSKRVIIPGGVDTEKFTPPQDKASVRAALDLPQDRPILLTIRRLYARMGLVNLLQATGLLLQDKPELLLLVGGIGPLQPHLELLIEQLGLRENVRLLGFISEEQLPHYYQAADLFILPSIELEGFGLVTLEALASGLPVLATPVGGTVEILQPLDPNLLLPSVESSDVASGILRHLNNPTVWTERCRHYALEHYSWERAITQLEALFQQVHNAR
jgi:glycosyltransferase involved in cell wall biosynthesis